jgi:type IV pilus assembly protein PilA
MRSQGFTLIQLMVVVIITGIFLGLAIPFYELYNVRNQVLEGLSLADPVRLAINQYTKINKRLPVDPLALHYSPPELPTNIISINIDKNAIITITYAPDAGGGTITLAPTIQGDKVTWNCNGGNIDHRYRPPSCK